MRKSILSSVAVATLGLCIAGSASAATYTVQMWGGSSTSPLVTEPSTSASLANVPSAPADVTFTYTGDINWVNNEAQNSSASGNLVKNFIPQGNISGWSSPSGAYSDESAWLNSSLSKAGDAFRAFFQIKGSYSGATASGTITHDDGASLYVDNGTVVFEAPSETVAVSKNFNLPGGTHNVTLEYVEGNGAPSVLNFNISATPEPATWALMMVGVGGMGAALRTRRRKAIAA